MSFFNKDSLSNFFGLSGDADYNEYTGNPDAITSQHMDKEVPQQTNNQQTIEPLSEKPSARYRSTETNLDDHKTNFNEKKVVSMRNSNKQNSKRSQVITANDAPSKITIVEPRVYSESMNIAKYIIANNTVLINFHLLEENQARRIVDFLTGTVYALDGDIQRVGNEIFLCTPPSIEIDSTTAQSLVKKQMLDY